MAWSNTYTHSVAIGLDQFGAAVIFNRPGITISSMCRIVQGADAKDPFYVESLRKLKLSEWQVKSLRWCAKRLNQLQHNHCELARLGDIARSDQNIGLLKPSVL